MKIFAFTEIFPSPYKQYHETQFQQFLLDGHALTVFSFGEHKDTVENSWVIGSQPIQSVRLPSSLRGVYRTKSTLMARLAENPILMVHRLRAGFLVGERLNLKLANSFRNACLPAIAPDLCLVHNLVTMQRLAFLRDTYPGCPIAFYYHGGELPGMAEISPKQAEYAFLCADVVFTNTNASARHAISRGCSADKIRVCPVGFRLDDFVLTGVRRYRQDDTLSLLTVGRLSVEKGHMFSLQAIQSLLEAGAKIEYRIVGDGPEEPKLRGFVENAGLSRVVSFIGRASRQQLWDEYRRADVLVLPSIAVGTWEENQACVVQEAMLAQCVPCVSLTGGVPESTAPEALKYGFAPESVLDLYSSLLQLSALDREALAHLGATCRKFAVERYDIRGLNERLLVESCGMIRTRTPGSTAGH